jgi:hypothetical protein
LISFACKPDPLVLEFSPQGVDIGHELQVFVNRQVFE